MGLFKKCCGLGKKERPVTILTLDDRGPSESKNETNPLGGSEDLTDGKDSFNDGPVDYEIPENKISNQTTDYDQDDLIVRRACQFKIRVNFKRELNTEGDTIALELKTTNKPTLKSGTLVRMTLAVDEDVDRETWSLAGGIDGKQVGMCINVPPSACLGKYSVRLYLRTRTVTDQIQSSYIELKPIYVLANPFTDRDTCWNPDSKPGLFARGKNTLFIEEYVLNENGAVWRSSSSGPSCKPWTFGQFEAGILDVACHLLANDKRVNSVSGGSKLSDLVQVARILSAQTNCNEDDGVLVGNWSGEYSDGKSPTSWNNSVTILQQFKNSGYQPVCYGQCWVFSAVLVTLLRTMGIPARSVTNYSSAHDTDNTMTIDHYKDENNEDVHFENSSDSIWNFHVWNECWLNRPDLPADQDFDGWQAVDSTPQESSGGLSQCGPCPVKAIYDGKTYINYDTAFVFAEVNADTCYWLVDKTGELKSLLHRSRSHVGKKVLTTEPGAGVFTSKDITRNYKPIDETEEHTKVFNRAFSYARNRPDMRRLMFNTPEIPVKLEITSSEMKYGENISVTFNIQNNGNQDLRTDEVKITVMSIFQRGEIHKTIGQFRLSPRTVQPGQTAQFKTEMSHEDYKNKLSSDGQGAIRVDGLVKLDYSGGLHTKCEREYFTIDMPSDDLINIMVSHRECRVNDNEVSALIQITNKFNFTLTSVKLTIDGRNLFKTANHTIPQIPPGQKLETSVKINPIKEGIHTVMVDIDAAEVVDIKAMQNLTVTA